MQVLASGVSEQTVISLVLVQWVFFFRSHGTYFEISVRNFLTYRLAKYFAYHIKIANIG